MSDYRIGDVVIFGRKQGEKTLGTVVKVNQKTVKVRQEEQRGTMKSHKIGTVWKVPFSLVNHATGAEAARLQDRDTAQAAPSKSQVPPRKPSARPPVEFAPLNPKVITDGSKLRGKLTPSILEAAQKLVGKTIAQIGYIKDSGDYWPIIVLDDGTEIVAQRDDAANGPGVLHFGAEMLCEIL